MFRHRPDLFLSLNYIIPTIVEDDISGATVLPIEEQYFSPIVEYIVGVTELSDDEFTVEGRAVALLSAFRIALLGVGR